MRVSLTGHRVGNLGQMVMLAKMWMIINKPSVVCSGMAMGWDTAGALAAVQLGIPLEAYVPFASQCWRWPNEHYIRHAELLSCATKVEICSEGGYSNAAYIHRNVRLVESCDVMLAWFNGVDRGGTAHAVKYAAKSGIEVINLYS